MNFTLTSSEQKCGIYYMFKKSNIKQTKQTKSGFTLWAVWKLS